MTAKMKPKERAASWHASITKTRADMRLEGGADG